MPAHQLHPLPPPFSALLHQCTGCTALHIAPLHSCCTMCTMCSAHSAQCQETSRYTTPPPPLPRSTYPRLKLLENYCIPSLALDARIAVVAADWDVRVLLSLPPSPPDAEKAALGTFYLPQTTSLITEMRKSCPFWSAFNFFGLTISGWATILVSLLFSSSRLLGG